MIGLEDWLDDPNEYECPCCGSADTRISGYAGPTVGVKCADTDCEGWHRESGAILMNYGSIGDVEWLPTDADAESMWMYPPEDWVVGERQPLRYQCPACESTTIDRDVYDDGLGHFDVRVVCRDCEEETWE